MNIEAHGHFIILGDIPLLYELTFSRGLPKKFDGSVDLFCKFARGGFFIAFMETCKYCGSTHRWKHGVKDGSQQWMCADCHRTQCEVDRRIPYKRKKKKWQLSFIWKVLALEESLEFLQRWITRTSVPKQLCAGWLRLVRKLNKKNLNFKIKLTLKKLL